MASFKDSEKATTTPDPMTRNMDSLAIDVSGVDDVGLSLAQLLLGTTALDENWSAAEAQTLQMQLKNRQAAAAGSNTRRERRQRGKKQGAKNQAQGAQLPQDLRQEYERQKVERKRIQDAEAINQANLEEYMATGHALPTSDENLSYDPCQTTGASIDPTAAVEVPFHSRPVLLGSFEYEPWYTYSEGFEQPTICHNVALINWTKKALEMKDSPLNQDNYPESEWSWASPQVQAEQNLWMKKKVFLKGLDIRQYVHSEYGVQWGLEECCEYLGFDYDSTQNATTTAILTAIIRDMVTAGLGLSPSLLKTISTRYFVPSTNIPSYQSWKMLTVNRALRSQNAISQYFGDVQSLREDVRAGAIISQIAKELQYSINEQEYLQAGTSTDLDELWDVALNRRTWMPGVDTGTGGSEFRNMHGIVESVNGNISESFFPYEPNEILPDGDNIYHTAPDYCSEALNKRAFITDANYNSRMAKEETVREEESYHRIKEAIVDAATNTHNLTSYTMPNQTTYPFAIGNSTYEEAIFRQALAGIWTPLNSINGENLQSISPSFVGARRLMALGANDINLASAIQLWMAALLVSMVTIDQQASASDNSNSQGDQNANGQYNEDPFSEGYQGDNSDNEQQDTGTETYQDQVEGSESAGDWANGKNWANYDFTAHALLDPYVSGIAAEMITKYSEYAVAENKNSVPDSWSALSFSEKCSVLGVYFAQKLFDAQTSVIQSDPNDINADTTWVGFGYSPEGAGAPEHIADQLRDTLADTTSGPFDIRSGWGGIMMSMVMLMTTHGISGKLAFSLDTSPTGTPKTTYSGIKIYTLCQYMLQLQMLVAAQTMKSYITDFGGYPMPGEVSSRTQFILGMSHDVLEPAHLVMGYIEDGMNSESQIDSFDSVSLDQLKEHPATSGLVLSYGLAKKEREDFRSTFLWVANFIFAANNSWTAYGKAAVSPSMLGTSARDSGVNTVASILSANPENAFSSDTLNWLSVTNGYPDGHGQVGMESGISTQNPTTVPSMEVMVDSADSKDNIGSFLNDVIRQIDSSSRSYTKIFAIGIPNGLVDSLITGQRVVTDSSPTDEDIEETVFSIKLEKIDNTNAEIEYEPIYYYFPRDVKALTDAAAEYGHESDMGEGNIEAPYLKIAISEAWEAREQRADGPSYNDSTPPYISGLQWAFTNSSLSLKEQPLFTKIESEALKLYIEHMYGISLRLTDFPSSESEQEKLRTAAIPVPHIEKIGYPSSPQFMEWSGLKWMSAATQNKWPNKMGWWDPNNRQLLIGESGQFLPRTSEEQMLFRTINTLASVPPDDYFEGLQEGVIFENVVCIAFDHRRFKVVDDSVSDTEAARYDHQTLVQATPSTTGPPLDMAQYRISVCLTSESLSGPGGPPPPPPGGPSQDSGDYR